MKPVTQLDDETARLLKMPVQTLAHTNLISTKSFSATRIVVVTALMVLFCAIPTVAFAQTKAAPSGGNSKGGAKKTTINFEDQLVEGQAQKPELFYLLQQRNNNFKRLIRLRENFIPEMRKSSEDVGRPGGSKGSEG